MNSFFLYWSLRILTFLTLLYCGYRISYSDKRYYWLYGFIAGTVYSLNYGLRWNRSWDYPHYYQDLTGKLFQEYPDITYLAWIDFFKFTGLPFWIAFIFYSAILFLGFILILSRYPKAAVWALPLFFTFPTNVDNFVRQFFATSFLFMGYYFMELKHYWKMAFFYLICCTIHFSGIFAVVVFLFFNYIKKIDAFASSWILVTIIVILLLFWDVSYLDKFGVYLSKFDVDNSRAQLYISGADYWFTQDGDINLKMGIVGKTGGFLSTISNFIINFVAPIIIICYGIKALRLYPEIRVIFWSTVLTIVVRVIGGDIEIYSRFYCWLVCMETILVGIIMYIVPMRRIERWSLTIFFIVYFYYYNFLSYIQTVSPLGYDFVWDK